MFLKSEFEREIKRLTKNKANESMARVKEATPVKTGFAKASWRIEDTNVVSDCNYMPDLNHGTSTQAPSFFIEKTLLLDPTLRPNGTIVIAK